MSDVNAGLMFEAAFAEDGGVDNVSRPLIALLVGTVALFALYFVALRGSSNEGTSKQSLKGFQSDISAAHHAVSVANGAAAAAAGTPAATTGSPAATAPALAATASTKSAAKSSASQNAAKPAATALRTPSAALHRQVVVTAALGAKKVLALLFYNPAASDDRAVKQELAAVPTNHNRVVKLAVPIGELANYQMITTKVPVNQSPTLVLIDRNRQASTIVGYASGFEIAHRVADAAAIK